MKKSFFYLSALFLFTLTSYAQSQEEIGVDFINTLLVDKNYTKAYDFFDDAVKAKVTLFAFEQAQVMVEEKYGKFIEILEKNNEENIYYYYSKFEENTSDIKIRFTQENKISGFIFTTHKEFDKKKITPKN